MLDLEPHEAFHEDISARQEDIIRNTYRLIGSKGMNRLTLQDVADTTGLSKAAIVYYFKTKENLVLTTMRWVLAQVAGRIRQAIAGVGTPEERVRAMIGAIFIDAVRNRNFYLAYVDLVEYSARAQSFSELSTTFRTVINSMYAELIREGIADRKFHVLDVEDAAVVTRALIDGLFLQWLLEPDWKETHAAYEDMCTRAVLSYLGAA